MQEGTMRDSKSNVGSDTGDRTPAVARRHYETPRFEKGPTLAAITATKQISGVTG
jgi:hypothetical protein